jgi:spore coat protein U-like protein
LGGYRTVFTIGCIALAAVTGVADATSDPIHRAGLAQDSACTFSATPITFGVYNINQQTSVYSVGTLTANCIRSLAFTVALSTGSGESFKPRTMTDLVNGRKYTLDYNLYTDPGRSLVWGDGTEGTHVVPALGLTVPVSLIVYGQVPGSQNPAPGTFTDTVTATITF